MKLIKRKKKKKTILRKKEGDENIYNENDKEREETREKAR